MYRTRYLLIAVFTLLIGCGHSDRDQAKRREELAKEKAHLAAQRAKEDARKLGHEVKQEAHELRQNIDRALSSPGQASSTGSADEKLRNGAEDLRQAGKQAAVKLDRAAIIAGVKAKLAADVGLSTVTSVDVDTSGHVVTLRGTVSSEDQKREAEQAAMQVSGVSRVINDLRVAP